MTKEALAVAATFLVPDTEKENLLPNTNDGRKVSSKADPFRPPTPRKPSSRRVLNELRCHTRKRHGLPCHGRK